MVNLIANSLLRIFGVDAKQQASLALNTEELKSVVNEGNLIPESHQEMLGNILDLEQETVDDIMIPRNELVGIDLDNEWDDIVTQVTNSQHTRLPVYRETMDNIIGFIHLRKLLYLMHEGDFTRENFEELIRESYYVPEGTSLTKQLLAFKNEKRRVGFVVDEYGDIQGLITLEDILEEIVGEFTTDPSASKDIYPQHDGSYIVDGGTHVRDINKALGWDLNTDGPKTLNGVITEYLEMIPESGTSLKLDGHTIEIVIAENNAVKTGTSFLREITTDADRLKKYIFQPICITQGPKQYLWLKQKNSMPAPPVAPQPRNGQASAQAVMHGTPSKSRLLLIQHPPTILAYAIMPALLELPLSTTSNTKLNVACHPISESWTESLVEAWLKARSLYSVATLVSENPPYYCKRYLH